MKTHYLHVAYQGQKDNGEVVLGDCILETTNRSLIQIREYLKNDAELKSIVITHLSELSKELYEMLSDKTEDNEQHREDKS